MKITVRRGIAAGFLLSVLALTGCPPQPAGWECDSVIEGQLQTDDFITVTQDYRVCDVGPESGQPDGRHVRITGYVRRHDDINAVELVVQRERFEYSTLLETSRQHLSLVPAPADGTIAPGIYDVAPWIPTEALLFWTHSDFDEIDAVDHLLRRQNSEGSGWYEVEALELGAFDETGTAPITHLKARYYVSNPDRRTAWDTAKIRIGRPGD